MQNGHIYLFSFQEIISETLVLDQCCIEIKGAHVYYAS